MNRSNDDLSPIRHSNTNNTSYDGEVVQQMIQQQNHDNSQDQAREEAGDGQIMNISASDVVAMANGSTGDQSLEYAEDYGDDFEREQEVNQ